MNILIINGNPSQKNTVFEKSLNALKKAASERSHSISTVLLREKTVKQCVGCFNCWWKTPGLCIFKDDSDQIRFDIMHSDLVIFASPVIMGFTSALLKTLQDKLIPLVHPYIDLVNGESRHKKRYETYPYVGLLLQKSADTDGEDIEIISDIYQQLAFDFRSRLSFVKTMEDPIEEICDALNTL